MTFQQLEYLLQAHRAASVSKAAKALFVSASSVSIAINSLEEELGYPLFDRTSRGLVPTPEGKLVIEYAERISESFQMIRNVHPDEYHSVRISATDYPPCADAFVRLVCRYKETPNRAFSMVKLSREDMLNKLATCQLDCGILFDFEPFIRALETELESRNLQWRVHRTVSACILLGPGHPLYRKESVTLRDLETDVLIENRNRAVSSNRFMQGIICIPPERILIADDKDCRYKLLAEGLGFSVSRKPAEDVIQKYGLRCIPLENIRHQIVSVTNPLQPVLPEVEQYLQLLDEALDQMA